MDSSIETVQHAILNYSDGNRSFQVGRAQDLPIADASIDVVVSFETLEHLEEHDEFLAEIKRVLRQGGLLVMSTPDLDTYSGERQIKNPHHLKELTRAEFQTLMRQQFKNAAFFVQSSVVGSVIAPDRDEVSEVAYEGFRRLYESFFERTPALPSPMYMMCVASDARLPKILAGSFDDRLFQLGLYTELQHRAEEILLKEAEISHFRPLIASLQAGEADVRELLAEKEQRLNESERELTSVKQALTISQAAVRSHSEDAAALRRSLSWKVTAPLRAIASMVLGSKSLGGK